MGQTFDFTGWFSFVAHVDALLCPRTGED